MIVKAAMVETDPTAVYLSVSDSGRGIPQESLPLVFERLYQDPDAVDGNRTGLGLGLYIAKEIVTLHGGRMWVASQPGKRQHVLVHLAALFPGQAPASGDRSPGTFAGGHGAGARGTDSAVQSHCAEAGKKPASAVWNCLRRCIYVDKDLVLPPMASERSRSKRFSWSPPPTWRGSTS